MQFTTIFTTFAVAFFAPLVLFAQLIAAMPVAETSLENRDVYTPPILIPNADTVWNIGERQNVTWDISNPPQQITNRFNSRIMFRFSGISTPLILADGFDILLGSIEVTVPWVQTRDDYQLVLFGDSGNFSPEFTINGAL